MKIISETLDRIPFKNKKKKKKLSRIYRFALFFCCYLLRILLPAINHSLVYTPNSIFVSVAIYFVCYVIYNERNTKTIDANAAVFLSISA